MNIQKIWQVLVLILMTSSLLAGCSKDKDDKKEPKGQLSQMVGQWLEKMDFTLNLRSQSLHVVDMQGKAVPQAQILVGESLNSPFAENFLTTDSEGIFVAPESWQTEQMVTISAPGFVRTSYFGQRPQGQTFQIRSMETSTPFELQGQGTGFQLKDKDNLIDFALVMPMITRQSLFAFDMGMFVSPISDQVDIYGQKISIPSNVILPKQKESFGFIPVELAKPLYRLHFQTPGIKRVFAARGQFPFKQVAQELQNNRPFLALVNYFSIQGGGLREVTLSGPSQQLDLAVNELAFNQSKNFMSPAFASDEFMLAMPMSPYQGEFIMTDVKNVPANTSFKLATAPGETPQLLVVVKKLAEQDMLTGGRLTMALVPFDENIQPVLLPMLENPQVLSSNNLKVSLPSLPAQIQATATYSVISTVETKMEGNVKVETLSRIWEIYSNQWQAEIKLPVWPNDKLIEGKKRWEVTLTGSQEHKNIDLSPRLFETVTHATHGAIDF